MKYQIGLFIVVQVSSVRKFLLMQWLRIELMQLLSLFVFNCVFVSFLLMLLRIELSWQSIFVSGRFISVVNVEIMLSKNVIIVIWFGVIFFISSLLIFVEIFLFRCLLMNLFFVFFIVVLMSIFFVFLIFLGVLMFVQLSLLMKVIEIFVCFIILFREQLLFFLFLRIFVILKILLLRMKNLVLIVFYFLSFFLIFQIFLFFI